MKQSKEYIGDSVYADFENMQIVLTTENGRGSSNTIYLEAEVAYALIKFAARKFGWDVEIKAGEDVEAKCE